MDATYSRPGAAQPPYRASAPVRPDNSRRMDGRTRLLIVGGSAALAAWFAWPFIRGEMAEIGRQVGRMNHSGVEPADVFGLRRDSNADRAEAPPRQGRYRACSYDGKHVTCGPWQDGAPPNDGRLVVRPGERPELEPRHIRPVAGNVPPPNAR